jgi:formylmethanofuran dehydrogenase subunit E
MTAQEILKSKDFQKCLAFHGHLCPGLSIGYQAARAGLAWLRQQRSEDEELVAIVESNACSADAIQVMTGCTFGKGNLIFCDYGKMVFTFLSRTSGQGVRVSLRPEAFAPNETHMALLKKVLSGNSNPSEQKRFQDLHHKRSLEILDKSGDELFAVSPVSRDLPEKAKIEQSQTCAICGEPTMPSKMIEKQGRHVCRDCAGA